MHSYSTGEQRVRVYAALAVISVVIAWVLVWLLSHWRWPEWLVSVPSLGGVYAGLYQVFNRRLWRTKLVRQLGLVGVDDISGEYTGSIISTWNDNEGKPVRRDVAFRIQQTWTQIEITMKVGGGSSSSRSQSAVASVGHRAGATHLVYVYRNQVNPGLADSDMADHEGAADIEISPDGTLSGRYFNSRPRAGSIEASRSAIE
jgi:hypothetical protein